MVIGVGAGLVQLQDVKLQVGEEGRPPATGVRAPWSDAEWEACARRADPVPGLAARLAAKGAALRALGDPAGASESEVEVASDPSGRPSLVLSGAALRAAAALGVMRTHVSLTHEVTHAAAVVVLEGASAGAAPGTETVP